MRRRASSNCLRLMPLPHRDRLTARHATQDLLLFRARRVADAQLQHEAVDLRFGQRIRAFLLDGVLRGEHEERFGERIRRVADGDLLFLHGLEQRACTFAGARLISSARTMLAKIGPCLTRNSPVRGL